MLSAAFSETCYAATPIEAAPTHDLSVAFVRDELFVGTALMRAGTQCVTWERTGWLAPGACAAAAAGPRNRSWTWISQRPDEVAFDWRRDILPRADLVVAQNGPHVANHKLPDRRLRTDFVPLLAAALRNRTSPPLFLLRTSHLPVEMCARMAPELLEFRPLRAPDHSQIRAAPPCRNQWPFVEWPTACRFWSVCFRHEK